MGLQKIILVLRGWGLTVHEIEPASLQADFVGLSFDGTQGTVAVKKQRILKIKFAIDELLERQFCSGRTMQLLVGRLTWALLCCRTGLSLLNACYAFIDDGSTKHKRLWKSVRQELKWVASVLPLLRFKVNSGWSTDITASDSSPWGLGVCYRKLDTDILQDIGRSSEKWRFRFPNAINARHHALGNTDPLPAPASSEFNAVSNSTVIPRNDIGIHLEQGGHHDLDESNFIIDGVFNEIPEEILKSDDWHVAWSRPWKFEANILNTEARALVWSAEHLLRCGRNFGRRLVCLTDNLPLALGVTKGRAKSSQLTKPLQKICALSLATQTKVHVRWLPSERNVADVPSRATDFWKAQGFEGWWERSNRDHAPQSLQSKAPEKGGSPCDSSPAKKGQGHVRGPNSHGDDIPRGEKRPRANQTGLSEKVQPVHGLVRKFDDQFQRPDSGRQHSGRVSSGPVRLRGQTGLRDQDPCCHQIFSPTLGEECKWKLASVPACPPGLEECRPSIAADATADRGIRCHTGVLHCNKPKGNGNPFVHSMVDLHEARGNEQSLGRSSHPTHEQFPGEPSILCGPVASFRGEGPRQDGHLRPRNLDRQRHVDQSNPKESHSESAQECTTVVSQSQSDPRSVQPSSSVSEAGVVGSLYVHPPSRRGIIRHHESPTKHGGSQAARQVGYRQFTAPICKDSKTPKQVAQNASRCNSVRQDGDVRAAQSSHPISQNSKAPVWNDKITKRLVKNSRHKHVGPKSLSGRDLLRYLFRTTCKRFQCRRVFLDLFCGDHGVERSLKRKGHAVIALDINDDSRIDLTDPQVLSVVLGWIKSGCVKGIWLATPYTSWSRARHGPINSSWGPLRNNQFLFGIPGLSSADRQKIKVGNATLHATTKVIQHAISFHTPCFLENPAGSMMWLTPRLQNLCQHHSSRRFVTDFCQHGARWRKRTRVQGWFVQPNDSLSLTCSGHGGKCSRTDQFHIVLKGRSCFKTALDPSRSALP